MDINDVIAQEQRRLGRQELKLPRRANDQDESLSFGGCLSVVVAFSVVATLAVGSVFSEQIVEGIEDFVEKIEQEIEEQEKLNKERLVPEKPEDQPRPLAFILK